MYCVNGKYFAGLYRNKFSGYAEWREDGLDCGTYFNSANIGPYMSPDETCLSYGEVWTFLTNRDAHGGKGALVAAVKPANRMCRSAMPTETHVSSCLPEQNTGSM